MSGFPLFHLHSTLLEKILSKLEEKSFFRLQQTCREIGEFVRINRNIKVSSDTLSGWLIWTCEEGSADPKFCTVNGNYVNNEALYGLIFDDLVVPPDVDNGFEIICENLKKYRISCKELDINWKDEDDGIKTKPTKEQCSDLFKILKPAEILLDSKGTDRLEALNVVKTVKEVYLEIHPDDALSTLKVVSRFEELVMRVVVEDIRTIRFQTDQFFQVLKGILQFLSFPALHSFRDVAFYLEPDDRLPPIRKQRKKLREYHPIFVKKGYEEKHIFKCRLGHTGPLFELNLSRKEARIRYSRDPVAMLNIFKEYEE